MSSQYIFDKDFKFRKQKTSVWAILRKMLMFFVATLSMAVLYYVIFALIFSTDTEKKLKDENRMYAEEMPALERSERLISDVVEGLQMRDDKIYEEIFHTSAPKMDIVSSLDFIMGIDSIPDTDIVIYVEDKLNGLDKGVSLVEENFRRIFRAIKDSAFVMPPMTNPIDDFSFAQTGASVGEKINPFYKVKMTHNGLDLIAPAGEEVRASADGVVSDVVRSRKGLGNVITIDHENGYKTRYAHLADMEVRKGMRVKKGRRLGYVGVSGNSFAPHLHYEVLKDTLVMDPVCHFFASVSPGDFVNMLVMSASTGQSMD